MCGPKFCSMEISHQIRDAAESAEQAANLEAAAIQEGLAEKSREFRTKGLQLYGE